MTLHSLLLALALTSICPAALVDITVNDRQPGGVYGADPRPGISESGEVSPGCIASHIWDLRAMAFDPQACQLTIVSGFNPLTTTDGYAIGDLFIDTNGLISQPFRPALGGYYNYPNPGYEYCLNISPATASTLSYSLTALTSASVVQTGYFAQNSASDPWALIESPADTPVFSRAAGVQIMTDNQVKSVLGIDVGQNGSPNFVWTMAITPGMFSPDNLTTFRLTEQCGNDLLVGQYQSSSVPELAGPLSLSLLIVSGLLIRRRP